MRNTILRLTAALFIALAACGDSGGTDSGGDVGATGGGGDASADASVGEDVGEPGGEDASAGDEDASTGGSGDAELVEDAAGGEDAGPVEDVAGDDDVVDVIGDPWPPLPTKSPLDTPLDPLLDSEVVSCATYLEETCEDGKRVRCEIYDHADGSWVDEPDELLERAFLFDRWRDLYNSPDGQAIDRDFNKSIPPDWPESEWGKLEHFEAYWGAGDGGIWTGWSVVAAILRYSQTGTEADYQRMEEQVRHMITMYEVTGIPGYMTRNHYLLLPEDGPNHPDHNLRWENKYNPNHHHRPSPDPASVPDLPAAYFDGIPDADGELVTGTVMWQGRPSIDQNSGPMTSLPMAYDLIRDETVKERIRHNLTCYLHRLQRIELINLQQNTELLEGMLAYFSVGELQLDEDDIDLTELDTIVGYVHRQVNGANEDDFDMGCPDGPQLEPWRVIDAASDDFVFDMFDLVLDMDTSDERPNQIDHYYFPSLRGGDAMHLMHLATMAYHFTGDDQYRAFLYDTLIGDLKSIEIMHTTGAFSLPRFCKKYYGDQITFGPWWGFLHLLDESPLLAELQRGFFVEMFEKLVKVARNTDFDIMMAGALPDDLMGLDIADAKATALQTALEDLAWFGGNGGGVMGDPNDPQWLKGPRRSYSMMREITVAEVADDGIEPVCPTAAEYAICMAEIEILGIAIEDVTAWGTHACTEAEADWECQLPGSDTECTWKQTNEALPPLLRRHSDYIWQRNAFALDRGVGVEGKRQFAGSDYSVPYWNARRYGFLSEGQTQVLGWRDAGACE